MAEYVLRGTMTRSIAGRLPATAAKAARMCRDVPVSLLVIGLLELVLMIVSIYLALLLRWADASDIAATIIANLPQVLTFAAVFSFFMFAVGLYQTEHLRDLGTVLSRLVFSFVFGFAALALIYFIIPDLAIWRSAVGIGMAFSFAGIVTFRWLYLRIAEVDGLKRRVLVLGVGAMAAGIDELERNNRSVGFRCVGFVPLSDQAVQIDESRDIWGNLRLAELAQEQNVEEIVVALDNRRRGMPVDALIVKRAMYLFDLEEENRRLVQTGRNMPLSGLITASTEMLKVCRLIERVADTDVGVLLLGESGTGKELLARAVHELSQRVDKPFCAINCAAIPENLMESELFGHEKGAFTGAIKQSKGKIELANTGTLFLDEIGDVPLAIQVKLLRFLQERVVERVGGRQQIEVDVRIVCATNQNLQEMIAEGTFREDLYYRLSEMVVNIPPLRDRKNDAELLAHSFMARFNKEHGRSLRGFGSEALAVLEAHSWPGNVRELENRIKRAVIMADGNRITPIDLDLADPEEIPEVLNLAQAREEVERREIPRALSRAEGNISQAAKLLGISRPTLYDLMRHHGFRVG